MSPEQIAFFRRALLGWYAAHARDLPWRRTRDPYLIWISEIMLQQTRVAAVLEHYARFTERFPTVQALAAAEEVEVLALWSGLGYYRRARMMHRAARAVVEESAGRFPGTAAALLKLPGIGAYTAAAVASIAFGEPVAVVDGNVQRVLTRVAGLCLGKSEPAGETAAIEDETRALEASTGNRRAAPSAGVIRELAGRLLDAEQPSAFNQGMMELGATVCLPRGPLCLQCPVEPVCRTRGEHATTPRKALVARAAYYSFLEKNGFVLLEQRPEEARLMAGMWQLPEVEAAGEGAVVLTVKHSITVTNYTVSVVAGAENYLHGWRREWVLREDAAALPLTGLARKILRRLGAAWGD